MRGLFHNRNTTATLQNLAGTTDVFANLPAASGFNGRFYRVTTASGTIFVNRKAAGLYVSDGSTWTYVADFTENDQAAEIAFNPAGIAGASATNVQAALAEIYAALDLLP